MMQIETLSLEADATVVEALASHAEGWGVMCDWLSDSDLSAALQLAAPADWRSLPGARVLATRKPYAAKVETMRDAGLAVVKAADGTAVKVLTGLRSTVLQGIARLTRDAARSAGMAGITWQIRAGYYADFVILDPSPLCPGDAPQVQGTRIEGVPVRPEADHVTI